MDIKRKESKLVISNQSSVIKTPKKKRFVLGFKKHSSYETYLSNMTNFLFKTKKRKLIFSLFLVLLVIAPISFYLWNKQAGASWWNSDWNYRRSITINSAQIPGDLNNFPMLVSFTDSNLINKTQSNGNDIIFIEENGTRLNHEIEKFDNTTGELVVWVKIPQLDGDNDSIIYMYYGNQTVDNQQRPEDVWDDNFKTVHHLEEDGTGTRYDSTRNNTDASPQNFSGDESTSSAKINGGVDLENDDDTFFDLGIPEALNISQQITLSAWVRVESDEDSRIISRHGGVGQYGYMLARSSSNDRFEFSSSKDGSSWDLGFSSANAFLINTWYFVTATYNGSNKRLYLNGVEHIGGDFPNSLVGDINMAPVSTEIGRANSSNTNVFDGIIDEVRISNTARSANWITTEYNNQNSPSTFISLGSEERGPSPALYLPFDEGFGDTAHDETSNRNDGTIFGATWKDESMCKSGKCLEFDGTGDYVEIADNQSLDLSEEVTLEAWVKPTSTTPQNQTIISKEEKPVDPTKIYRSVGPSATTAIAVGTSNAMTIVGDRATFANSLPDNVGVGDAIQYDSDNDNDIDANDKIVFIHERIHSKEYIVKTNSGGLPVAVNADNNWSLFRAYTSLANAENGIENTGININLRNFDDWTAGGDATTSDVGKDLVTANQQWNIACYANGTTGDSVNMSVTGWNTSKDLFIKVYTPMNVDEVGVSQRHIGKWDDNKYYKYYYGNNYLLDNYENIKIEGIQFFFGNADGKAAISLRNEGILDIEIKDNIIKSDKSGSSTDAIYVNSGGSVKILNNIIYGFVRTAIYHQPAATNKTYIYNNTIYDSYSGIYTRSDYPILKNNIVNNCDVDYSFYTGFNFDVSSSNNISNDTPSSTNAFGATHTTGTTDGTTANKLINSGETFITKGVQIGSIIKNTTDNTYTYVTALDSETQLSVANDIFVSGENYSIYKNKYGTASFISTTSGSEDFHLSPTDTVAKNSGADLSGDSVFPFNSDIDGQQRLDPQEGGTTAWDIGADEARATQIYRSVAPGKTDALETGEENAMTINGSIATFQRALADNIGVGDVIQYDDDNDGDIDANDSLAFIVERITNYEYRITNASGGVPTPVNSDTNWSLFRAYTSLANAENGDENTGIDSDLRNFDTWSGGKDLVTSKEQWNIACYANGTTADSTAVTVDGWTTGAQNFVKIYTPVSESEVGVSQRHGGKWDEGKYRLEIGTGSTTLYSSDTYLKIDGLQARNSGTASTDNVIGFAYWANYNTISNCILKDGFNGISYSNSNSLSGGLIFYNNIVYNSARNGILSSNSNVTMANKIYNNSVYHTNYISQHGYGCGISLSSGGSDIVKNNVSFDNYYVGTYTNSICQATQQSYNITSDSSATGTGSLINQTLTDIDFVSTTSGSEDLHILGTSVARNAGVNLANDPYLPINTDIDGDKRLDLQEGGTTSWDIGADEAVATKIYRSVGPNNTTALATDEGHKNVLNVLNGEVSFSASLPDRVGVGDAVLIDTNNDNNITSADTLLFISGRNSSTSYNLQTNDGATPSDIADNDTYQIFRAYTSLANAENGTKNTSIPITFNGGNRDLVTNNEEWNIACYKDSVDVIFPGIQIDGWETGKENFIKIFTPFNSDEVGVSQRHNGIAGTGYQIMTSKNSTIIGTQELNVSIDGLEFNGINVGANNMGINSGYLVVGDFNLIISNNLLFNFNNMEWRGAIHLSGGGAGSIARVFNNIVSDASNTNGGVGIRIGDVINAFIFNNTIYNCNKGIGPSNYTVAKNNITQNCTDGFSGTFATGSDFNISDLAGDAPGANSKNSTTVTFRDAANDDFRLAMTDTAAKGAGINLSNDINLPITHDIEGELRPSLIQNTNFDIGADQISNTVHNNYSLNLKTDYPQANFSTSENDRDNFSSGDINLPANTWSHIAYKRSNDIEELYINGSKKDSGTISNFLKTNNGKLYLGSGDANSKNSFKGFLDEVRIYPYARTETEIKKDKTQGSSGRAASRAQEGISVAIGDQANNLSDGLVGYWKMDESAWTGAVNEVKDASGNNNHGTASGAVANVGKFSNGGDFDGTDDYVSIADSDSISITNAYTYAAWVRFDDVLTGLDTVISKQNPNGYDTGGREWSIGRPSAGGGAVDGKVQIGITHNQDGYHTEWHYPYQEWFHLTVSWDGSMAKIYSNGQLIDEFAISGSLDTGAFPLLLGDGSNTYAWDGIFSGAQDEVRLYNRALSGNEVQQLYNYAPGPVLHLKMDEKSGTTAFDSSGYNNHGTLINGPIWENGKINGGLNFSGNSTVHIQNSSDLTDNLGAFTVGGWIKMSTIPDTSSYLFISKWRSGFGGWRLLKDRNNATGKLVFRFSNQIGNEFAIYSTNIWPADLEWHYITVTYDGSYLNMYGDGKPIATQVSANGALEDLTHQLCVSGGWSGSLCSNGESLWRNIDDVKIYNYARTQEQILEDMGASAEASASQGAGALGHPILDLNFDEGQGPTAYDSSGNNNHGTLISGATGTNTTPTMMWDKGGKKNGAMEFDGTDDYINAGSNINIVNKSFTISSWAKRNSINSEDFIAGQGLNFQNNAALQFGFRATGYFTCAFYNNDLAVAIVNDTDWHHWVCSYDAVNNIRIIYRDGKEIARGNATADYQGSGVFNVGARYSPPVDYFDGLIDEFKLYNYTLSEAEIKTLYNDSSAMVMGNDESRDNNGTEVTGANKDYCIPGDTAKCDKPVLELKMDEMTGTTAYDTSGNGNNGTLTNGPIWEPNGKVGSALKFDGVDDYITVANSTSLNPTRITMSAWVYPKTTGGSYDAIFSKRSPATGADFQYKMDTSNNNSIFRAYVHIDATNTCMVSDSSAFIPNQWYQLSYTYDGSNCYLYKNGKKVGNPGSIVGNIMGDGTEPLNIGQNASNGLEDFNGLIDDVKIYNYARTPAQIAWDYNQGKPINHWTFDEGTGSTVHDEGPNLNNGTITGATWKNESECKNGKCLYFDGLDTTRVDADTQDNMSQFTACAWVNAKSWTNAGADGEIFIISKGWSLRLINDGKINLYVPTSSTWVDYITTSSLVLDEWHRVCVVFAGVGQNSKIFIDGIDQELSTSWWGTGTLSDNSSRILRVGASDNNSYYGNFNGYIDDPKIYNYALTDEQIKMDYNDGAVNFR